jgi:hypothetical protein
MATPGGNTVSIVVETTGFTYEIDENGDLLFPEYDIAHDLAAMEFGYPKTPAIDILDNWKHDATTTFMDLLFSDLTLDMAILITRAWLDMVVDAYGINDLSDIDIRQTIESIDRAILYNDDNLILEIENNIGYVAASYQQQAWRHGGSSLHGPSENFRRAQVRLNLVSAIYNYILVSKYSMHTWVSLWQRGGKSVAIGRMTEIPNSCVHEMALNRLGVKDELICKKLQIRREFVGAAVRAIVKAEEA